MKKILILAISLFMLQSCYKETVVKANPTEIETYIQQNPNLDDLDKDCLYNGNIKIGIKATTLQFMLGEPKSVEVVEQPWGTQEEWYYKNGGKKKFIIEDGGIVGIEEMN
jgi:hypothetical protein